MKMRRNNLAHILGGIGVLIPVVAAAQTVGTTGNTAKLCELITNIFSLVGVFGTIILMLAFLILLYAAFLFVTSGGNEEQTKQGRQYLLYALIGLAVAFLAVFADNIVVQLFTSSGTFLNQCLTPVLVE